MPFLGNMHGYIIVIYMDIYDGNIPVGSATPQRYKWFPANKRYTKKEHGNETEINYLTANSCDKADLVQWFSDRIM